MSAQKKILVVGGGFAGILSIKSLKEEDHIPVCYEKSNNLGGMWNYKEESVLGSASVTPFTILNNSKEMGAVSNFPPDKEFPNYMKPSHMCKYSLQICSSFDLFNHITFNREVVELKRSETYELTGMWDATIQNTQTGEFLQETFEGVMVAVGQFSYPKIPHYPGLEEFKGVTMHTHSLKSVNQFRDKNVLVIGVGSSGMDAAAEISKVSSQVYLSSRSGTWLTPRLGPFGLPFDYTVLRRIVNTIQSLVGFRILSWCLEKLLLETRYNHILYNFNPKYHLMSKNPVFNDLIPYRILTGSVIMRNDVKRFTEEGVIFDGESQLVNVDAVVFATGYKWDFPFLENGIVVTENGRINLYKNVYPPHLKHPTLAIMALVLPLGPGLPIVEMQSRWVCRIFSRKCQLPTQEKMIDYINKSHQKNLKRYAPSDKISLKVDFMTYLDDLAVEIGVKPDMWKLLYTDPVLFMSLAFGPFLSYQYRLTGPHQWNGARRTILTAYERVCYPFSGHNEKKFFS